MEWDGSTGETVDGSGRFPPSCPDRAALQFPDGWDNKLMVILVDDRRLTQQSQNKQEVLAVRDDKNLSMLSLTEGMMTLD